MTAAEFRDRRLSAGLSVRQAAARLHVAPSSITRWESGARGIPSESADQLRSLVRNQDHVRASYLVAQLRKHGLEWVANAVQGDSMVTAALVDGVDVTGWRFQQIAGAILFVQVRPAGDGSPVISDGERVLCLYAPAADRERWEKELMGAGDAPDAPVTILFREDFKL